MKKRSLSLSASTIKRNKRVKDQRDTIENIYYIMPVIICNRIYITRRIQPLPQ